MDKFKPDQILNLKGVTCPINFVKTKLKLEEMDSGKILEITIDDGEPIRNMPRAVKEEGHRILKVEKLGNAFKIVIRKS